jgi:protein FrlC
MDAKQISEVRKVLDDTGITISNFIPAQFRYPSNPASVIENIRRGSVDYLKKSIDVAEEVGSPYVSLCPGFSLYDHSLMSARGAMMQSFRECIEHSKDYNVTLILEPANRYESDLVVTVEDGLQVIEELGGDMGILADAGHMHVNREPLADTIRKIGDIPFHFHIDDNMGVTDDHLVPGEGKMDYDVFLTELDKMGYEGFLAVELGFGYTVDPDPAVRRSIEFLKTTCRRLGINQE